MEKYILMWINQNNNNKQIKMLHIKERQSGGRRERLRGPWLGRTQLPQLGHLAKPCELPSSWAPSERQLTPRPMAVRSLPQAHTCLIILATFCWRVPFLKQDVEGYGIQVIHPRECPTTHAGMTLGVGHRGQPTAHLVSALARGLGSPRWSSLRGS
uniref:Uncharacterized protein n=1 Tax=Myotis myotis TaxID=51298 RepID=A0A7J7Z5T1_MYOMY|nr:hypothetical protein mMyoMyo1_010775 [Myotis myotis]